MKKVADYVLIRQAFNVTRYHTVGHVLKSESVGHHTANVIGLLFHLYEDAPPLELIKAALHHDVAEAITGDIPATAKWEFSYLARAIEEAEKTVALNHDLALSDSPLLKFADMADLCMKCVEEMTCGNMFFAPILARGLTYLQRLLAGPLLDHKRANELYAVIVNNPYIYVQEVIDDEAPQEVSQGTKH